MGKSYTVDFRVKKYDIKLNFSWSTDSEKQRAEEEQSNLYFQGVSFYENCTIPLPFGLKKGDIGSVVTKKIHENSKILHIFRSSVIDSLIIVAKKGGYLDSATYENVRMDLLPLSTRYIEVAMFCEGGPQNGVVRHKELKIIPQKPKLVTHTDEGTLQDSIPAFIQNQIVHEHGFIRRNSFE